MMHADLPEDLQHLPRGVLMGVLGIDPYPPRAVACPAGLPPHLSMDPFDPTQADAWRDAVAAYERSGDE